MHLLFILPVFPEKYHPSFVHTYWVERLHQYFLPLKKTMPNFQYSVVMGEHVDRYWALKYPDTYGEIKDKVIIDGWALQNKYSKFTLYNAAHNGFNDTLPPPVNKEIQNQIDKKCYFESYDLAISFFTKLPVVEAVIKEKTLFYYFSEGGITRAPFPISWKFDPIGFCKESIASKLLEKNYTPSDTQSAEHFMQRYRDKLDFILRHKNPFEKQLLEISQNYKKTLLLPLQVSGRCSFDCLVDYQTQTDYLYSIVSKIPEDTALIVTEHPSYPELTKQVAQNLKEKFPHLIIRKEFLSTQNASLFLLPYVDGVINVSSSIGWLALILKKYLFVAAQSEFSNFSVQTKLENLWDSPVQKSYDCVLANLIRFYWINEEALLCPRQLRLILEKITDSHNFEMSDPLYSDDQLIEALGKRPLKARQLYLFDYLKNPMRAMNFNFQSKFQIFFKFLKEAL